MSQNAQALAVGEAMQNMTSELQDYARLHSVWDIATHDAFAIARDPALADPSETGLEGYFRVVVYSSRLLNTTCPALGLTTFDSCITRADPSNGEYWDVLSPSGEDAGGPGDRVAIGVDFNHPLITPFLMTAWPYVHLTTIREGIVENFRTSKTINVAAPIGWATWTPSNTPTITNTPTNTKDQHRYGYSHANGNQYTDRDDDTIEYIHTDQYSDPHPNHGMWFTYRKYEFWPSHLREWWVSWNHHLVQSPIIAPEMSPMKR